MNRMSFRSLALIFSLVAAIPSAFASDKPFEEWITDFRQEAVSAGISPKTINLALTNLQPSQRVIDLDQKQPESQITFAEYFNRVVTKGRIKKGRELMEQHEDLLEEISRQYGVAPQYIVALWGIESDFGRFSGNFNVVQALASLAWDGRREDFFKAELIKALRILDQGHIDLPHMTGSWAGAMGQNQFMPSSFLNFAVDGDGDGRKDIWGSLPDVFASTSNYLVKSGWRSDERWGREVELSTGFSAKHVGLGTRKSLAEWEKLGVRLPGGGALPTDDGTIKASLVAPDGIDGQVFLVYENYRVIMKWNRSTYFATAVGLLANAIAP